MKTLLTEAIAIGNATARAITYNPRTALVLTEQGRAVPA